MKIFSWLDKIQSTCGEKNYSSRDFQKAKSDAKRSDIEERFGNRQWMNYVVHRDCGIGKFDSIGCSQIEAGGDLKFDMIKLIYDGGRCFICAS